jgi:hypothetical protein
MLDPWYLNQNIAGKSDYIYRYPLPPLVFKEKIANRKMFNLLDLVIV